MADITLKNLKGAYYIAPDGSIIADGKTAPKPDSISIVVDPADTDANLDLVTVVFPDIQVEAYSKKKNTGAMSGTVQVLLRSLWIEQIDNMEYDEGEDKLYIDCTLAADEGDIDDGAVDKVVDEFKSARKEHNALCKPATKNSDSDSNDSDGNNSDSNDSDSNNSDSNDSDGDGNPPAKDKPKKKRQPRKADESATGAKLEHITQAQADLDTHATLVAIGGEEFAKNFNGLVWDEATQTYKDET